MTDTDLVLLTNEFPSGFELETYLEAEIPVLAETFRRVYVLPSYLKPGIRPLPANVELVQMPWLTLAPTRERARALASSATLRVLAQSATTWRDLLGYRPVAKLYADILSRNILKARALRDFTRRHGLFDAIFYDYWFQNSTLGLALYRQSGEIRHAIARAHRFDIFEEAWEGHPVPFQQAKAMGLDAVYPTSQAGARYLAEHVPALRTKLHVHRLGALDPGRASPPPVPGTPPLVLTCARLTDVKRIHRVPRILARLGEPVRWVHIGDGPEQAKVRAAAETCLPAGSWELLGHIPNSRTLAFYARESVQVLLSVASSEGLPVSMMEAQSFGVPIVSCDVGGVAEIVTPATGILVDRDTSDDVIADALRQCLREPAFSRDAIRAAYHRLYDANANYQAFANSLLQLKQRAIGRPTRVTTPR